MPKKPKDMSDSPKIGNYKLRGRKKKKKELVKKQAEDSDSDSDSSSDWHPGDDESPEMDNREFQKFIQKIFPSKSGKERLKQLDKIDKMMEKESKKKKKKKSLKNKSRNRKIIKEKDETEEEEIEETEEEEEEVDEDVDYNCEGFPECEDEELDEEIMISFHLDNRRSNQNFDTDWIRFTFIYYVDSIFQELIEDGYDTVHAHTLAVWSAMEDIVVTLGPGAGMI